MIQPFVYRHGVIVALLAALQAALAPLIAASTLYLVCRSTGTEFDAEFATLTVLSLLLSSVLLPPSLGAAVGIAVSRWSLAVNILARWGVLLSILFAIGYAVKTSEHFSRQVVLTWAVLTPVLLILSTLAMREVIRRLTIGPENARLAIFAGCNDVSMSLCEKLASNPEAGVRCVGFFDDRSLDRLSATPSVQLLGRLPDLAEYVKQHRVDMIFIALPVRHVQRVMHLLDDLRDTTASIYYVPDIFVFDLIQARTGDFLGIPVVAMCETPFHGYRGAVKRLIDIGVSALGLLVLAPLLAAIAIAVRCSSPGPAIFKQRRYGLDGREIIVYKFRSMSVAEDGERVTQAQREDSRVTRIGKLLRRSSLDELPQLINVLQGTMSLVGPRPHAVAHNEEYRKLIKGYMVRHKVLPGITGLAQVSGCRGETTRIEDMQKRVNFDLEYLRNWSPALDLKILALTVTKAFRDDKAY
ncbi:MAG: undecaprenyl-phosphate glucose phosphotransferase [Steroidobacteraceae bacterium]